METTDIREYIAYQTLELKSQTASVSLYSLIWSGKNLMISWDLAKNEIMDCYGYDVSELSPNDISCLHRIISHKQEEDWPNEEIF
jgi:hypothetical protein